MADFRKTEPLRTPTVVVPGKDKSESLYWRNYKDPVFVKNYGSIDSINFSGSSPYRYAVTTGTRVQIYSPKTAKVVKTITRFKDTARSGSIRDDGKLIVAADDSGEVQVFDINSRGVLRSFKNSKLPVHSTCFSPHPYTSVLAASDDATVQLYDLATGNTLSSFIGHEDYTRTASFLPSSPSLAISGSYDSTVRLWDSRSSENNGQVRSFDHGYPVESVLVHPSGSIAVSAGGPVIRVWDLLSGNSTEYVRELSNHQKTITCLAWDGEAKRLLSGGLDGLVKVYRIDRGRWKVGHTMRYGGQILSLGVSPDDTNLVVGTSDGSLSIRRRTPSAAETAKKSTSTGYEALLAGQDQNAIQTGTEADPTNVLGNQAKTEVEVQVPRQKTKKLKEWDRMLKSFRHADALDAALKPENPPTLTFAVISELIHRNALQVALNGRDDISLEPILSFLYRYITDPRFASIACDATNLIIDLYTPVLGQSRVIDGLLKKLCQKMQVEAALQDDLVEVKGQLDMLFAANLR